MPELPGVWEKCGKNRPAKKESARPSPQVLSLQPAEAEFTFDKKLGN
jgi:hypothetical protein